MSKTKSRQKARRLLVQALYAWELSGNDLASIEATSHTDNDMSKVDSVLFHTVLHGVAKYLEQIESAYQPHLDREHRQLDPISRTVLRISTYELLHSIEVPYKVVINEGVNLAKTFGPTDAYKFINGVLDRVAEAARTIEVSVPSDSESP